MLIAQPKWDKQVSRRLSHIKILLLSRVAQKSSKVFSECSHREHSLIISRLVSFFINLPVVQWTYNQLSWEKSCCLHCFQCWLGSIGRWGKFLFAQVTSTDPVVIIPGICYTRGKPKSEKEQLNYTWQLSDLLYLQSCIYMCCGDKESRMEYIFMQFGCLGSLTYLPWQYPFGQFCFFAMTPTWSILPLWPLLTMESALGETVSLSTTAHLVLFFDLWTKQRRVPLRSLAKKLLSIFCSSIARAIKSGGGQCLLFAVTLLL